MAEQANLTHKSAMRYRNWCAALLRTKKKISIPQRIGSRYPTNWSKLDKELCMCAYLWKANSA